MKIEKKVNIAINVASFVPIVGTVIGIGRISIAAHNIYAEKVKKVAIPVMEKSNRSEILQGSFEIVPFVGPLIYHTAVLLKNIYKRLFPPGDQGLPRDVYNWSALDIQRLDERTIQAMPIRDLNYLSRSRALAQNLSAVQVSYLTDEQLTGLHLIFFENLNAEAFQGLGEKIAHMECLTLFAILDPEHSNNKRGLDFLSEIQINSLTREQMEYIESNGTRSPFPVTSPEKQKLYREARKKYSLPHISVTFTLELNDLHGN